MYKVYGISNCNTVKKALDWLKENEIKIEFHDYKKAGITTTKLIEWSKQKPLDTLINKNGTTWRMLDPATQKSLSKEDIAIEFLAHKPSLIKRPIIEENGVIVAIGCDEAQYKSIFLEHHCLS